jgi:hypothetical protein
MRRQLGWTGDSHPEGTLIERVPVVVQPAGEDEQSQLDVCPLDVARELSECLQAAGMCRRHYRLAARRMKEAMNSAFREAATTRRRHPVNFAHMSPEDMTRESLTDGDRIIITSDAGVVVAPAKADDTVRTSVISIAGMWDSPDPSDDPLGKNGAFTGRLVSLDDHVESINFMPQQTGVPIDIHKCVDQAQ